MVDTPMNANATGKKMSPAEVAEVTLEALARRRPMALPGPARHLPMLLRLAPGAIGRTVGRL
jgi:uncharacterized oxidoreductase